MCVHMLSVYMRVRVYVYYLVLHIIYVIILYVCMYIAYRMNICARYGTIIRTYLYACLLFAVLFIHMLRCLILQIVDVNLTSEGKTKLVLGESISFSYQVRT